MAKLGFSRAPCVTQRFPRSKHSPTLHLRASSCTSQIPSPAVPGCAQGTLKAAHSTQTPAVPWVQASHGHRSSLCPHLQQPDTSSLLRSSLQSFFGASRYQCLLPTPWHSPGTAGSPQGRQGHADPTHSTSPWLPTMHRAPTNRSTAPSSALP